MLAQILCLSRRVNVLLKREDDEENLGMRETVVYAMEGSTIDLSVTNYHLSGIYMKSAKAKSQLKDSYDTLLVDTQGDENIVDISHRKTASLMNEDVIGSAACTTVRINTLRSGSVLLNVRYSPPAISTPTNTTSTKSDGNDDIDDEISGGDNDYESTAKAIPIKVGSNDVFANVRVVVVPTAQCASAELAELISLLENSFVFQRPLFLDAFCVQAEPELKSEEHSNSVKTEWRNIENKLSDKSAAMRK